ncbi:MAG: CCA tRNA nucleotidyltransferase [Myxococcaceae bacterium]
MSDPFTQLRQATVPPEVVSVLERLVERGFEAYLVGGCVRDLCRGVKPKDFDVATSARPEEVIHSFHKVIPTGVEHGTVTVLVKGTPVEVTTFRSEGAYVDGRRPSSVEFHSDIEADLSRRDFTINAMAYNPSTGKVVDPFGGAADLSARVVRCVGNPAERFAEDGLRPLRAVRFYAVLGFDLDPLTEAAIAPSVPVFRKVAHERVREELTRLLLSARAREGLELLQRTKLLAVFLPELIDAMGVAQDARYESDVYAHTLASVAAAKAELDVRLAALLHDLGKPRTAVPGEGGNSFPDHEAVGADLARTVLDRLRFPNKTIERVSLLVRHHRVDAEMPVSDAQLRRLAARVGQANVEALFELAQANRAGYGRDVEKGVEAVQSLRERMSALLAARPPLDAKSLALDGRGIMTALGVGPSPLVGAATRHLLDQVLEDPARNTPESLAALLADWARSRGA